MLIKSIVAAVVIILLFVGGMQLGRYVDSTKAKATQHQARLAQ